MQTKLIEDLLDVSRILQGKLNLEVVPVDLVSTIEAAIETVRKAAQEKSLSLQFSILNLELDNQYKYLCLDFTNAQSPHLKTYPRKFTCSGDSKRLQQIVWNLLSNAVKFTPPGGRVDIELSIVSCLDSSKLASTTQNFAQIKVKDTGIGIEPEFLPYVFESFRQADNSSTRKFGGLGLGLAIVRNLVELHNGTIKVQSLGVGQGATFTLVLPLLQDIDNEYLESPEHLTTDPSLLADLKVLVVDDEPDVRELLVFMLGQYGAIVTAATSAEQALQVLADTEQHLLLSDISMPLVDGYMLMRQVRASIVEQHRQIPAIALTGYTSELDRQHAHSAGFQKSIAKPVEQAELITAIASLTGHNI